MDNINPLYTIKHNAPISCLQITAKSIFTGCFNGMIYEYNKEKRNINNTWERLAMRVYCIAVSTNSNMLYCGCDEDVLRAWSL